jgi:hypothetical protein
MPFAWVKSYLDTLPEKSKSLVRSPGYRCAPPPPPPREAREKEKDTVKVSFLFLCYLDKIDAVVKA